MGCGAGAHQYSNKWHHRAGRYSIELCRDRAWYREARVMLFISGNPAILALCSLEAAWRVVAWLEMA